MDVIADDLAAVATGRDAHRVVQADFVVLNGPALASANRAILDLRVVFLDDEVLHGDVRGAAVESVGQFAGFDRVTRRVVGNVDLVGGIIEIEGAGNDLGEGIDRLQRRIVDKYGLRIAGPLRARLKLRIRVDPALLRLATNHPQIAALAPIGQHSRAVEDGSFGTDEGLAVLRRQRNAAIDPSLKIERSSSRGRAHER